MNILIDELPEEYDGIKLNTSFRNIILFELLMQDDSIKPAEKFAAAVDLVFAKPAKSIEWATEAITWFYRGGDLPENQTESKTESTKPSKDIAYDFDIDANLIFAAFQAVYGIDLNTCDLHWWKFRALFYSLPDTCRIREIMKYRTADLSKLKGAEKRHYSKLKSFYKIHRDKTAMQNLTQAARETELKAQVNKRFEEALRWKNAQALK